MLKIVNLWRHPYSCDSKSEEERIDHEHELCPHRLLHCVWAGCEEMVKAKDRRKHSEEHVTRTGVSLYTVPGKYTYKVKGNCRFW